MGCVRARWTELEAVSIGGGSDWKGVGMWRDKLVGRGDRYRVGEERLRD